MEWQWVSVIGQQAPALTILCVLVYFFFQDRAKSAELSEARIKEITDAHKADMKILIAEKDATIKAVQETLATSNSTLGGIAVLLTLVEKDLKEAKRAPRT